MSGLTFEGVLYSSESSDQTKSKIFVYPSGKLRYYVIWVIGLSADGQVEMPMDENPDGTYFSMFRDKFGMEWMVKFDPNK